MKTINLYVVTYNNEESINNNVQRFLDTTKDIDTQRFLLNYHIINNHSNFRLKDEFKGKVHVIHNSFRLDNSCGHLARDYNAAIMHGFRNLGTPAVDQVIHMHDDSVLIDNWLEELDKIHSTYTLYMGDFGCGLVSYLPDAVRKIGLWDERFCNIGYHEADYQLRARIYNNEKSTINDQFGGRVLNPTRNLFDLPGPNGAKQSASSASMQYHAVSRAVFAEKWGVHPEKWGDKVTTFPTIPLMENFVYYPYFERDVEDLKGKNYVWELEFKPEWH